MSICTCTRVPTHVHIHIHICILHICLYACMNAKINLKSSSEAVCRGCRLQGVPGPPWSCVVHVLLTSTLSSTGSFWVGGYNSGCEIELNIIATYSVMLTRHLNPRQSQLSEEEDYKSRHTRGSEEQGRSDNVQTCVLVQVTWSKRMPNPEGARPRPYLRQVKYPTGTSTFGSWPNMGNHPISVMSKSEIISTERS